MMIINIMMSMIFRVSCFEADSKTRHAKINNNVIIIAFFIKV